MTTDALHLVPAIPNLRLVPVVGIAVDRPGQVACEVCGSIGPNTCTHGHNIGPCCEPDRCTQCANDLSDLPDADLADDLRKEGRW